MAADDPPALAFAPAAVSETGRRANNEDAVFASSRLLAVADGVGGAEGGEVASRLVIDALIELDKSRLWQPLEDALTEAVRAGAQRLAFVAGAQPTLSGMGTTLTAVALSDDGRYLIANVGDSRAYLWRECELRQLTRDDSLVQELIDQGAISDEEARGHPLRSIVVRALDSSGAPSPALASVDARAGDRLLLCSDGLTDTLADNALAEVLAAAAATVVARSLVARALAAGAADNVSVIVADVVASMSPDAGWLPALSGSEAESAT